MLNFSPVVKSFALEEAAANNGGGTMSIILMVLVYALVIGALWFFMMRPPVSYTHLDVYKRQPYSFAKASQFTISGTVSPASHFGTACRETPMFSATSSWEYL